MAYDYTFTESGTFIWPAGVTAIRVEAIGGGGGGCAPQSTNDKLASGGGGAAYASTVIIGTPGQSYAVTIGVGGIGKAAASFDGGSRGNNGTNTDFSLDGVVLCRARGGGGGEQIQNGVGGGGLGGRASLCIGDIKVTGGRGGTVYDGSGTFPGPGGGAAGPSEVSPAQPIIDTGIGGIGDPPGGSGGNSYAARNSNGDPGFNYGGAGAGGKGRSGSSGSGAPGVLYITFNPVANGSFEAPQISVQPKIKPPTQSPWFRTLSFFTGASLGGGVFAAPKIRITPIIAISELQATDLGLSAPKISVQPILAVGVIQTEFMPIPGLGLKAYLDRFYLQEIKALEQFTAGQDTYKLKRLLNNEVDKVLVSGESVPFVRFKYAVHLDTTATGPVIVVPIRRIDSFQLGSIDPVEIFITTNPMLGYSNFNITSINILDKTPGSWEFSLTLDGIRESTLLSDSVPESLWVFPGEASFSLSYSTTIKLSASASLRKK